jgi:nucleotide-binding universal stress UspA family protein
MFKNILLFIEPNISNKSMLECALSISQKFGSRVSLIAVMQPLPKLVELAILENYANDISAAKRNDSNQALTLASDFFNSHSIDVNTDVIEGIPFVEIIYQVAQHHYDLVMIMADNHKSSISEKFFGSTQMHLLRKCPCPVWIVKPNSGPIFKRILTPVDATSEDDADDSLNRSLVQATKAMLKSGNESINFIQVWSVYGEGFLSSRGGISEETINHLRKKTLEEYKQNLELVISEQDWDKAKVNRYLPRSNYPAEEIIKLVEQENIDLLIMGTVCRTGIAGFIIGNTAEKVLNEVSCSVLAFKPEGFVSPVTVSVNK